MILVDVPSSIISGLAAAYKLKSNGFRVVVFEAEERAGGKIRSGFQEGLIWDEGANTMVYFTFKFILTLDCSYLTIIRIKNFVLSSGRKCGCRGVI